MKPIDLSPVDRQPGVGWRGRLLTLLYVALLLALAAGRALAAS